MEYARGEYPHGVSPRVAVGRQTGVFLVASMDLEGREETELDIKLTYQDLRVSNWSISLAFWLCKSTMGPGGTWFGKSMA